ncbi:hypothetical protein LGQ02_19125 [Bacillus shivajii]|uniref:hypothetical protein n=1 Tax=Bacillus shivajii TaxID=1983719 RepID=UPI001CFAE851|nr:hypothetical protein [Bacillus shivajii]UCZ52868.1 hypothetical protein LGQ02_19125 [Bacillus shivajii]
MFDQMIYWSGYAADLDLWIEEQKKRRSRNVNLTPTDGWFCKTADNWFVSERNE